MRDVNGPRGGVDKECQNVAKINRMGEVVAAVKDDSLPKSIRQAIARAERGVARKIQKQPAVEGDRRSDFGFAFYN